jgi:hypothetical protein
VGDSFTTRLVMACRSAAAAVVGAGSPGDRGVAAAAEFVETYSGLRCTRDQVTGDIGDPTLGVRVVGDLMLVAEDLRPEAARYLLDALTALASVADAEDGTPPGRRQAVLAECARHLGL